MPPVLAADASQAAKDATKVVEVVADDAYDQKVLDYLAALGTYRDGLAI
jgi:hypothetical protein